MALNATLLNTQHHMKMIKGKVEKLKEMSSTFPNKKRIFESPSTKVANFSFLNTYPILLPKRLPPCRLERMYYTLGGVGLGHALVGTRIWSGVSWFQWQSVKVHLYRHPRASEGRPQAS